MVYLHSFLQLFAIICFRFKITDGNVSYQCRFIQTDVLKRDLAANRIVANGFGTAAVPDPCQTIFQRISSAFSIEPISDNTNVSVYPFDDEIYTFTESTIIHR